MTWEVMALPPALAMMRAMKRPDPVPPHAATPLGQMLREWRAARRISQFDLALDSRISARHLSYVENGKAHPSRELLGQIADALDMPLRERNALLLAAGYAPSFRESALTAPEMAVVARAIEMILAQQEPFPAFVVDRHWNVLMANGAMARLLHSLKPGGPKHANILHQVFDPDDLRPCIANWDTVAADLIRHLHDAIARAPSDRTARTLLDEVLRYPDTPASWRRREVGATPLPVITTVFAGPHGPLGFFSTLTTFGTSWDVTAEETRIECMHPLDERTRAHCRALAQAAA